ncbi:MAG: hypothetical protein J0L61_10415, partial [Planctomycetes bacterium]|nr:hypothetical protein [Planctomycetota bacterium]
IWRILRSPCEAENERFSAESEEPLLDDGVGLWLFLLGSLDRGLFIRMFMVSTVQHRAPSPGWSPLVIEGAGSIRCGWETGVPGFG